MRLVRAAYIFIISKIRVNIVRISIIMISIFDSLKIILKKICALLYRSLSYFVLKDKAAQSPSFPEFLVYSDGVMAEIWESQKERERERMNRDSHNSSPTENQPLNAQRNERWFPREQRREREDVEPVRECFSHTVVNVSSSRTRSFAYAHVRMPGAASSARVASSPAC